MSLPKGLWITLRWTVPSSLARYLRYTSLCTGEPYAIRKHKYFLCRPFYVKGVSLGYVGRIKT